MGLLALFIFSFVGLVQWGLVDGKSYMWIWIAFIIASAGGVCCIGQGLQSYTTYLAKQAKITNEATPITDMKAGGYGVV
jgi:hypothetical protein